MNVSLHECGDESLHAQHILCNAFLAGLPPTRSLWQQARVRLIALSERLNGHALADLVVRSTLHHAVALQYPRNGTYVKGVLEWLRTLWEERQWRGKERFREGQNGVEGASIAEENLELGYKSYLADDGGKFITLLESFEGISRGTTGLSSWGAARVLSSWVSSLCEEIRGKAVVELGAGVGFAAVSILSSRNGKQAPALYTATDYHPHVLSILHHNLSLLQSPKEMVYSIFFE